MSGLIKKTSSRIKYIVDYRIGYNKEGETFFILDNVISNWSDCVTAEISAEMNI